ncbi:MAG TPA: sialidase family protein, partial [Methylomirabilota bacterium]
MRRILTVVILVAALRLTAVWASTFTAGPLTPVSGASPFAACTADNAAAQPGLLFLNSEVEPMVDVNPTDARNLVGAYQQDRWSNGGSRGLVAGVSLDGGTTWMNVVIPKVTLCSGGTVANGGDFQRASDPWLSFAPNGNLYFMTLALDIEPPAGAPGGNGKNAMFVSKSTDRGLTWSDPIKLIEDTNPRFLNDKNSITADPGDPHFVYAVWDRLQLPVGTVINPENVIGFGFKGPAVLSRTTNGGTSWEPARVIFDPGANQQTIGNQIVVLPDGTLVDFFNLIRNQPPRFEFTLALIRSMDHGATWTRGQPIRAARMLSKAAFDPQAIGVRDPDTGAAVRTGDIIPEVAVDRNVRSRGYGNLYAVWQDSRFSNNGDFSNVALLIDEVAFARSTDGGTTWSTPIKINLTPTNIPLKNRQAFTPAIRVAADGTIGVTYYDFRNNTGDPSTL